MKIRIYLLLTFIFLTTVSCVIDVPDTDRQPPKFSFTIEGDGFKQTFTQDDDFNSFQLNLQKGTIYQFTFSGSDNGDLKNLSWTFPGGLNLITTLYFPEELPLGWRETSRYDSSSYGDGVVFEGNTENPMSTTSVNGEFSIVTGFDSFPYYFEFTAIDYGGMSGNENVSRGRLHISLVGNNQPTKLISRNASN